MIEERKRKNHSTVVDIKADETWGSRARLLDLKGIRYVNFECHWKIFEREMLRVAESKISHDRKNKQGK